MTRRTRETRETREERRDAEARADAYAQQAEAQMHRDTDAAYYADQQAYEATVERAARVYTDVREMYPTYDRVNAQTQQSMMSTYGQYVRTLRDVNPADYATVMDAARARDARTKKLSARSRQTAKRAPQGTCDTCGTQRVEVRALTQTATDTDCLTVCDACWGQMRARCYNGKGCDICRNGLRKGRVCVYDDDGESLVMCRECWQSFLSARRTRQQPKMRKDARA